MHHQLKPEKHHCIMKPEHLSHLRCPHCVGNLSLEVAVAESGRVKEGALGCGACSRSYPITRFIPRFVETDGNYTAGFGFQWNRHAHTQYDSYSGAKVSERRFFGETRWARDLTGQLLLEAGSGSGRFTEQAASTGAMVVSFDYSNAVDANYANNQRFENLLIVQASIYQMPFEPEYFDKVVCIGVVQHTPDPEVTFRSLLKPLKRGGELVIDVYKKFPLWKQLLVTKYWVRPITKKIPNTVLYRWIELWVRLWWPITGVVGKLFGTRSMSWFLLIADYRGVYPLADSMQREWAVLDSFDMLSPAYDYPQSLDRVRAWLRDAGLTHAEAGYGANGIEARGTKA